MVKNLKICHGVSCTAKGSKILTNKIKEELNLREGECNSDYCLEHCLCTAHCEQGINVRVDDKIAHGVTVDNWREKVDNPVEIKVQELNLEVKDDFLGDI